MAPTKDDPHATMRARLAALEGTLDVLTKAGLVLPEVLVVERAALLQALAAVSGPQEPTSMTIAAVHGAVIAQANGPVFVGTEDVAARERAAMIDYRRFVLSGCERLSTRKIEREQNDPTHAADAPELANVYVELDTTERIAIQGKGAGKAGRRARGLLGATTEEVQLATEASGGAGPAEGESRPVSVLERFARTPRVALVGHAGYGKSTVMSHTALCLAKDGLEPGGHWNERIAALGLRGETVVPVVVVLRELGAALPERLPSPSAGTIVDFVEQRLREERHEDAVKPLRSALQRGLALILLDGLDEVPVSEGRNLRAFVRAAIEKLVERYPSCRVVVSCRVLTYEEDGPLRGFHRAELAPLDEDKIRQFVKGWYSELSGVRPNLPVAEAMRLSGGLQQAIECSGDLREMAQSPLLLTVMAVVHASLGELPDAEAELYREAVDILLWKWGQVRGQSPKDLLDGVKKQKIDLLVALRQLAYDVHARTPLGEGSVADIPASELVAAFKKLDPRRSEVWAEELLAAVQHRAGLLLPAGQGSYRFPHRTYQELLAGWHLVHQPGFAKEAARLLREDPTRWRKAVLLGVGLLVRDGNLSSLPQLIAELCPRKAVETDEGYRHVWRAGEVLWEVRPERLTETDLGAELVERVRERLCALVEGGKLPPRERVEAGRVLGRVGDPRFRPEAWGLPADDTLGFVRIPAGPFWMGSDKELNPEADDDELPRHEVPVSEVWMARYPVTVGQWRAFVRTTGFEPRTGDSLSGLDNEPVRWISWEEAREYARWLDATLRAWGACPKAVRAVMDTGGHVRLPTEAEWEKAARGTEGRQWPWGDTFDDNRNGPSGPGRANTGRLRLDGVSPVGCFPFGATPEGLHDMVGNVWEWMQTAYHKYPYRAGDGREDASMQESRLLRGGAFDDEHQYVRCAYRNTYGPDLSDANVGFRLLLSPF